MFKILIIISLFLQMSAANAKIIETNDLNVIREEALKLSSKDLITMDVKGVIFTPKDQILSPNHVSFFKKELTRFSKDKGEDEYDRLHGIVILNYEPRLVDETLPSVLKELQEKKIKIVALTSGKTGPMGSIDSREDLRIGRLLSFGIDFSTSFDIQRAFLDKSRKRGVEVPYSMYKKGVIFAARNPKGETLGKFLKKVEFKPKKLIHIDNRLEKLSDVEKFCADEGIEFLGVHYTKVYGGAEQKLNREIANKKLKLLVTKSRWVSDKVASCMVDTGMDVRDCMK